MEVNPVDQFKAILVAREHLDADIETASSFARDAFEAASERASAREAELAMNPEVQEYFRQLGNVALNTNIEIEQAKQDVSKLRKEYLPLGLVDAVTVEQREAQITEMEEQAAATRDDPEMKAAAYFIAKYMQADEPEKTAHIEPTDKAREEIVQPASTAVEPILAAAPAVIENPKPNAEKPKHKIEITLKDNEIHIARRKMPLSYFASDKKLGSQRLKALTYLIKEQGDLVKASQLWREISDTDEMVNRSERSAIRKWLNSLTFNNKPIISIEGATKARRYGIVNFEVALLDESTPKTVSPQTDNEILEPAKEPTSAPKAKTSMVKTSSSILLEAPPTREDLADVDKMLSIEQAAVAATFMSYYRHIFEKNGGQALPEIVLEKLNDAVTAQADFQLRTTEELRELRCNTLERIKRIFEYSWILEGMVDNLPTDDPRLEFIFYMMDIDSQRRWELLEQVVNARTELEADIIYSKSGFEIRDIRSRTISNEGKILDGMLYWPDVTEHDFGSDDDQGDDTDETIMIVSHQPPAKTTPKVATQLKEENETNPKVKEKSEAVVIASKVENQPAELTRVEALRNDTRKVVRETLHTIVANSLEGAKRPQLAAVFRFMNRPFVRNARENGIIGREDRSVGFQIEEIIRLQLLHEFPNEFRQRHFRREIEKIVKEEIERFKDKSRER